MPDPAQHVDPTELAELNERLMAWSAPGETIQPVGIRNIVIEEDAIDAFVEVVRRESRGRPTMLVMDHTPMARGGDDLKPLLEDLLAQVVPLTVRQVPKERTTVCCADMESSRSLAEEIASHAAVVAVGSGSVTDVVKYARHLATEGETLLGSDRPDARPRPNQGHNSISMISFPTAASVTAYTSDLAVLTVDGVKRTLPARAPDVVVCDLRTLADAPAEMTRAGFGDVLARSVAYGDWYLAGQLGMDDGFSLVPGRLLAGAERAMIDCADQVANADVRGLRCVVEALLLSGMAMSVVKQTAPISGWEHVISHYLDLTASADGRAVGLHGAQVGVATLVAARAYEIAWPKLDLDLLLRDVDVADSRRLIKDEFLRLDPSGRLSAEIWRDLEKKLTQWNRARDVRRQFVKRKIAGELEPFLQDNVRPSADIEDALARCSAPRRFSDLNEPISVRAATAAVLHAHTIRSRFTLGDLLFHTGWLDAARTSTLLDEPEP